MRVKTLDKMDCPSLFSQEKCLDGSKGGGWKLYGQFPNKQCAFYCGTSPRNWIPIPLQGPAVGRGMAELLLDGSFSSLDLSALSFDRWPLSGRWTDDQMYSLPVGQNIFESLRDECFCLNNNKQNKLTCKLQSITKPLKLCRQAVALEV